MDRGKQYRKHEFDQLDDGTRKVADILGASIVVSGVEVDISSLVGSESEELWEHQTDAAQYIPPEQGEQ